MVTRSIVFKMYVYGVVVVLLTLPISLSVGHWLTEQGRRESMRQHLGQMAALVARDVAKAMAEGEPLTEEALEEIGRPTGHRLRLVPWSATGQYPEALREQPFVLSPRLGPREEHHHWQRIQLDGEPVAALELTPGFRGGRPPRPGMGRPPGPFGPPPGRWPLGWELAVIWIAMLALIIVPPLWLWVIRPLKAMEAVAGRLGSGDLDTPVAIDRKDEFGNLERAFESMRVALREAMAQRERLLIDVSHEVRGPLSRMTLAVPLLRQEGASGPITDIFERELLAADAMLADLLALFRARSGVSPAKEPTDLAAVAELAIAHRAIVAEQRGMAVVQDLQPAPVMGDARLLDRAIGNLLDNALKYAGEGAEIRVESGVRGQEAFVAVTDNGPGIAPEHLPRLLEPFYRPDDSRSRETGGTGLGLSIVEAIAKGHGGRVSVRSVVGQGTVVELVVPGA